MTIYRYMKILLICLAFICPTIDAGKIYTIGSHENFKEILQTYDLVVADFYADWCEPCRRMHKIFESLAQDSELDTVLFVKVDMQMHHALSNQYHILSLPTIILFADGKIINTVHGYRDKKKLKQIIQESFF